MTKCLELSSRTRSGIQAGIHNQRNLDAGSEPGMTENKSLVISCIRKLITYKKSTH